jgi:hypothetical protein
MSYLIKYETAMVMKFAPVVFMGEVETLFGVPPAETDPMNVGVDVEVPPLPPEISVVERSVSERDWVAKIDLVVVVEEPESAVE